MAKRTMIAVRVADTGLEQVDALATETDSTRSDVIRAFLAEGLSKPAIKEAVRAKLKASV